MYAGFDGETPTAGESISMKLSEKSWNTCKLKKRLKPSFGCGLDLDVLD